jgi:hypothetical protein
MKRANDNENSSVRGKWRKKLEFSAAKIQLATS